MRAFSRSLLCGTAMVIAGAAVPAWAVNIDASSTVDAVTVYPDGASVTRLVSLDIPAGEHAAVLKDLPLAMDPSSLRVEGEAAAKLTIGAIDARSPLAMPPVNLPDIERRIETLRDARGDLQGSIDAATARRKFAERFASASPAGLGEKGEARPIAEWKAAFAAVGEEINAADTAIREAQRRQRDLDREIARLEAERVQKPSNRMEVRIDLASAAATRATLRVTYTVRSARWVPMYDARLDSGARDRKPALELVRRAEITQSTGEDWSDVALTVSTMRTSRGGSAPELGTMLVQYPQLPRPPASMPFADGARRMSGAVANKLAAEAIVEPREQAAEQQAAAEIDAFQVVYRIPGRVSVGAQEGTRNLRIATAVLTPELTVRAAPVIDPTAFLEASFKQTEDAPLLPGRVAIYRDGVFVGRGQMAAASKDETVRLGFGVDDKVKIERSVIKRNEGSAGLIVTTAKTDERSFRTTVRNGHDFPIRVAIQDQLPVSENEEIQVEMLASSTPPTTTNLRDRRGVMEWAFDARAGEVKDIAFGWRMRWPKDKGVVMTPAG